MTGTLSSILHLVPHRAHPQSWSLLIIAITLSLLLILEKQNIHITSTGTVPVNDESQDFQRLKARTD
jgi:hypothetical protein